MFKRSMHLGLTASLLSSFACAQITSAQSAGSNSNSLPIPAQATNTSLLQDAKSLFNKFIDIRVKDAGSNDADVHVKVPFVAVDVKDGQKKVNVRAPFVNVSKATGTPVALKAPFVKKQNDTVSAKAALTNVVKNTADGTK